MEVNWCKKEVPSSGCCRCSAQIPFTGPLIVPHLLGCRLLNASPSLEIYLQLRLLPPITGYKPVVSIFVSVPLNFLRVTQPKLQGLPKKSEPQLPPLFARLLEEDVISPIRKRSHRRSKTRLKFFRWPLSRCAFPAETSSWCSMTAALKTIQRCVYIRVSVCPEIFISFHLLASDCWAILSLSWLRNPTSRPKAK